MPSDVLSQGASRDHAPSTCAATPDGAAPDLDPYIERATLLSRPVIVLPFPPSSLSGHAKGHWRARYDVTRKHRNWARLATMDAKVRGLSAEGDIPVHIRFVPPDRRGDRTNFANRMKPYLDGIADALGVNDARFLPSYAYAEPEKPGRVEVTLGAAA